MNSIRVIDQTEETVTVSRADFEAVLNALLDARPTDAVAARHAQKHAAGGCATAKHYYLTGEPMARLLAGDSAVKIWREQRGLTQSALAQAAGVNAAYLSEIEAGKKPGSAAALRRLAEALGVAMERLVA